MTALRPAAQAFDAAAPLFDARFGEWQSVAAQRRAVRRALLAAFPRGARLLEIGGGTGEDAVWLARRGYKVFLTDPSPAMVARAQTKLRSLGSDAAVLAAEDSGDFAAQCAAGALPLFDGVFSNFAPLNCVQDLEPVARGLSQLVRPGGMAALVLFGIWSPGEILTEILRGRPGRALRRFRKNPVAARLGGKGFTVTYHRAAALENTMRPWFRLVRKTGIGIFAPPSAAEPWISRHPRLLAGMEALDRLVETPLAPLGDHVLYQFERHDGPCR